MIVSKDGNNLKYIGVLLVLISLWINTTKWDKLNEPNLSAAFLLIGIIIFVIGLKKDKK